MRRQWVDHERFLLLITRIPRFLLGIEEKEGERGFPAIWTNRIMWAGLAASLCWCLLRALAFYRPGVPLRASHSPLKIP